MNKRQKKKQLIMRNKKLVKRYPFLLPRNCFTGKVPKDYDYTYTEYDCLDKGWRIGFGQFLLEDLREACLKTNFLDRLQIVQWKEKYGGMRLYVNGAPQEVHDVIRKYEFISEYVCWHCGSPEATIVDNYGWYLPMCKCCWDKNNKQRELGGYRTKSWEEVAELDDVGLPDEYHIERFSKEGNIHETYDIRETTKKIRQKYRKRRNRKISKMLMRYGAIDAGLLCIGRQS